MFSSNSWFLFTAKKKATKALLGVLFLTITLATILSSCKIAQPSRVPFTVVESKSAKNWQSIFSQPKNISVTTLVTGHVKVNVSDVLNLKNPNAKGIKDSSFYVPVLVQVIQHPVYGDWLIDAGLDSSFYYQKYGNMKGLFKGKFVAKQNKGQDITTQLATKGILPKGVFFTHLHADHIAGVPGLPKDIEYICGKGEKITTMKALGIKLFSSEQLSEIKIMKEMDFSSAPSIAPLGAVIDVFGDGSLFAIATAGHTLSHISFIVNSSSGPVLLTGDVSHTKIGFEKVIEPGKFSHDKPQNLKSLMELIKFTKEYPQVKVVYGHEQ